MKIIGFASSPVQPFWSAQVQALAPWISRLRNSLGHTGDLPAAPDNSKPLNRPMTPCVQTASNDSIFDSGLPTPSRPGSRALPASAKNSLRVVRESDSAILPDCAGRMVISGRMADVCAELDRMALRSAAISAKP